MQLVFRPHTDTAQASRVQIMQNRSELCLPKQFVQVGEGRVVGEKIESAVCLDFLRCAEERAPGCQRESGTDRDAAHTKIGEPGQCKLMIESRDEDVDWFWRDGLYDLRDFIRITDSWRVKTIDACFSVRCQSLECGA